MFEKVLALISVLILAGCQSFAATGGSATKNFDRTLSYPTLQDFGDQGGDLIVAVYDTDVFPKRLRLPKADVVTSVKNESAKRLTLGSFVKRAGLSDSRTNPLLEIGALYYFPNRYNKTASRTGKVIQKVCETVDGHQVDEAVIVDEPSGISNDRRRLVLDGSVDASLIKAFSGVTAKANAKYLFEFQIIEARLRSINPKDGAIVRQRLLAGNDCENVFLPQIGGNDAYQLTSAYYGRLKIKQVYELGAQAGIPKLNAELGLDAESERDSFLFFKVFLDRI